MRHAIGDGRLNPSRCTVDLTLGKALTHICLCHQAALFDTAA